MKISFSTDKKTDAAVENNVRIPYAATRRVFPKFRWILILVLVSSPFILLLGKILLDWLIVTSPGTIWLEKKTINSIEAGTVDKVFYHKGDVTEPDTVLFRVKRRIPENRKEQIALLEAERDAASKGSANGYISVPSAGWSEELELAKQSAAHYEQVRNDTKWLFDRGAATRAEMDAAENKLRDAKAAVAALTSGRASAADNAASASNAARSAQVDQSIASLKKMTEEFFDIKAGLGGKVSSVFVSDGQSFAAGEPLAAIVNTNEVHVVAYVDPKDFKKMTIGTVATVKMLGTGRNFKAVVEQPPVVADNMPSGISEKLYPVTMRGVQIYLKVLEPLQEEAIEGLPVVVEW